MTESGSVNASTAIENTTDREQAIDYPRSWEEFGSLQVNNLWLEITGLTLNTNKLKIVTAIPI